MKRDLASEFTAELYEFIKLNLDNFLKEYYQSNCKFWTNIIRSYQLKGLKIMSHYYIILMTTQEEF